MPNARACSSACAAFTARPSQFHHSRQNHPFAPAFQHWREWRELARLETTTSKSQSRVRSLRALSPHRLPWRRAARNAKQIRLASPWTERPGTLSVPHRAGLEASRRSRRAGSVRRRIPLATSPRRPSQSPARRPTSRARSGYHRPARRTPP